MEREEADSGPPVIIFRIFITYKTVLLLFNHSFIHSFLHSFIHPFIYSFIYSFIHLIIHSVIHSFIHSFIYSFIHSFIHSFTQSMYVTGCITTRLEILEIIVQEEQDTDPDCPFEKAAKLLNMSSGSTENADGNSLALEHIMFRV